MECVEGEGYLKRQVRHVRVGTLGDLKESACDRRCGGSNVCTIHSSVLLSALLDDVLGNLCSQGFFGLFNALLPDHKIFVVPVGNRASVFCNNPCTHQLLRVFARLSTRKEDKSWLCPSCICISTFIAITKHCFRKRQHFTYRCTFSSHCLLFAGKKKKKKKKKD